MKYITVYVSHPSIKITLAKGGFSGEHKQGEELCVLNFVLPWYRHKMQIADVLFKL